MSENLSLLSGRKGLKNSLFEKLVKNAKPDGTPQPENLRELAKEYLMGEANLYGAASFYDFLKLENQGKKVYVCSGSACLLAGTQNELKGELLKNFKEEEIGEMCCLGRCHENSAFHYEGKNYSAISNKDIGDILDHPDAYGADDYYVGSNMSAPILTAAFTGIEKFYEPFVNVLLKSPHDVLNEIKDSWIRGRGGAGFPMGVKLESCMDTVSDIKFIVCNADEGDPGAYSDRYLLEKQPHAVLLGMLVAGYVAGASHGVVYIRAEYPESVKEIRNAIAELDAKGLIGGNIKNSNFDFYFKLIEGAGAYICGEETALLSSIEGQRPEVRIRPPYPAQEGLFNKPTVVNNVETLAMVPHILRMGGKKVAGIGTEKSTGSKLVCLDSHFKRPGLYEVEMGTPLAEIVEELGQGYSKPIKALHIGGPLGGIVPVHKVKDLTLDFESFSENGFLLGHASIIGIPEDYPMVKYLEHLFEFTADESCGKCFPCSIGSVRGKELLIKAQNEQEFIIERELMDDLLETMEIGSLCALGGGLPLGVKNALHYFEDELKEFIA